MAVNQIAGDGITVEQFSDVWNDLVNGTPGYPGLYQIYGIDVNINQNSPDGQLINNFSNIIANVLDLLVQIYNSWDPDQAIGIDLDRACSYCGITRMAGTYTQVYVQVLTSQSLNLAGQDTSTPYTAQDGNGNQYQLIQSASLINGTNTLAFQAVNIGAVQCLANTITIQVTITAGITSVNNPSGAYQTGQNQETDAQLRQRRQVSVGLPAQGANSGLVGGLYTIPGLTQAVVYENDTSSTNSYGIPPNSIWVVTDGGSQQAIANMIYLYRNMGCGMYGGTTVNVTLPNGSTFPINFDLVVLENLFIDVNVVSINNGPIDIPFLQTSLAANYQFTIYSPADITTITALLKQIDPTLIVTSCSVSAYGTRQLNSLYPSSLKTMFQLLAGNITITI